MALVRSSESQLTSGKAALLKWQTQESELRDAAKAAKVCVRSRFERLACRERGVAALLAKIARLSTAPRARQRSARR
jgi:hypothetical protein